MPPARLSAALAALFPAAAVSAAELHHEIGAAAGGGAPETHAPAVSRARALLTAPEWQAIRHCREARIWDFTAGRLCARRALLELGVSGFSLLAGADRCPLWPGGIVGSITHTQGYSAAVVARSDGIAALGIDTEVISAVHQRLWPLFCVPQEIDWLWRLPADERARGAALIFAAKEAYFKCQYPLVQELLGFDAVQIEAPESVEAQPHTFRVLLHKGQLPARLALSSQSSQRLEGRYRLHGAFITVALALPVAALARPAGRGEQADRVRRRGN